jgi:hypothetical protein
MINKSIFVTSFHPRSSQYSSHHSTYCHPIIPQIIILLFHQLSTHYRPVIQPSIILLFHPLSSHHSTPYIPHDQPRTYGGCAKFCCAKMALAPALGEPFAFRLIFRFCMFSCSVFVRNLVTHILYILYYIYILIYLYIHFYF